MRSIWTLWNCDTRAVKPSALSVFRLNSMMQCSWMLWVSDATDGNARARQAQNNSRLRCLGLGGLEGRGWCLVCLVVPHEGGGRLD